MPDFDPAYQPTECVDCGHLFNPREARYGPYRRPKCHPCAMRHNRRAVFIREVIVFPFSPTPEKYREGTRAFNRDTFGYENPPEPEPELRPDGRTDLGIVAENRGATE